MNQNQTIIQDLEGNNYNLREQLERYLIQWKWFALSLIISLTLAFFYLRYAIPQYKAVTSILVKDEKKGGMAGEFSSFADLGAISGAKSNFDNEIEILKSRTLVESTVKKLGLNITYFSMGNIKSLELYKKSPIEILFTPIREEGSNKSNSCRIEGVSDLKFAFYDNNDNFVGNYNYGQTIKLKTGIYVVLKKLETYTKQAKNDFNISVKIVAIDRIVEGYSRRLNVSSLSKTTSIAQLSIVDPVKDKAEDFLNTLVMVYNEDAIEDKNFIFENTTKFIDQRLQLITNELDGVEKEAEVFMKSNRLTDIKSEAGLFIQNASEFEKKEIEVETQLKVVKSMTEYVSKINISETIPNNILTTDANASGMINQYNQLVLERNRDAKNAGPNNVVMQTLTSKLETLKNNIESSLKQQKIGLEINRDDLARQNALVNGKISQIPTLERESRGLGRQQQIKESLYLYLLQKREETAISLAVTEPNAKVIDTALVEQTPVSPKSRIIYLGTLLLGLLVPFGIIYIIDLLDTKVKSRFDFEGKSSMPFLGDVPKSESHNEIISKTSRTSTAEALRIVRTNIEFMLSHVPEGLAKTIFSTSTLPKEGKTFIAVNLAGTIALSGKRVLLIGLDIRNPKLDEYLKLPSKGLTNFLSTKDGDINDYIVKYDGFDDLYILPAGIIPPNPAELLMSKKVDELFAKLKQEYDYIVVDTAPVSLVTDTLLIAKNADAFVYVVRANYLDKRMLRIPINLYRENKLSNMAILLNDTQTNKGYGSYGYGYGYGYGVEEVKIPWYKKIFNK